MKLEEFLRKEKIDSKDLREVLSDVDKGVIRDYCGFNFVDRKSDKKKFREKYNELAPQMKDLSIYNFNNPLKPTEKDKLVLMVLGLRLWYKDKTRKFRRKDLY